MVGAVCEMWRQMAAGWRRQPVAAGGNRWQRTQSAGTALRLQAVLAWFYAQWKYLSCLPVPNVHVKLHGQQQAGLSAAALAAVVGMSRAFPAAPGTCLIQKLLHLAGRGHGGETQMLLRGSLRGGTVWNEIYHAHHVQRRRLQASQACACGTKGSTAHTAATSAACRSPECHRLASICATSDSP